MIQLEQTAWGAIRAGEPVSLYTLGNSAGMQVSVTDYGARIVSLLVPDAEQGLIDIVLGFDSLEGYLGENPLFGSLMGRAAGRIQGGRFTLDGIERQLTRNHGPDHLHGGAAGFDRRLWSGRAVDTESGAALEMTYRSPDGEEGYPGTLDAKVVYSLSNDNELRIDFMAAADQPTIVNLSNHSYFNLAGEQSGSALDCELTIDADTMAPFDASLIPTGEIKPVDGTPFDFRRPRRIGERIHAADEQLRIGRGYDVTYLLNKSGAEPEFAARLHDPGSGRTLEVHTTQPALQLYTACQLDGTLIGKSGRAYRQYDAVCLETEHLPDAPNHANFPSIVLRPGETYRQSVVYKLLF